MLVVIADDFKIFVQDKIKRGALLLQVFVLYALEFCIKIHKNLLNENYSVIHVQSRQKSATILQSSSST